jgi:hypothetical protein
MQDSNKKNSLNEKSSTTSATKKEYEFGGIEEFSLEKIEESILEESIYLDVFAGSEMTFKDNVLPLENVLSSLDQINCISFDYKTKEYANKGFPNTRQIGVIANEVRSIFPELVRNDLDGDLQVNYSQLSTIAIQAVKELRELLEISNNRIEKLEIELNQLKNN